MFSLSWAWLSCSIVNREASNDKINSRYTEKIVSHKRFYAQLHGTQWKPFGIPSDEGEYQIREGEMVVGPFKTLRGATYYSKHGEHTGNEQCRSVQDAEFLAKAEERAIDMTSAHLFIPRMAPEESEMMGQMGSSFMRMMVANMIG